MNENPLKAHFRRPAIYIPLPSNGEFYSEDALVKTENNEYPIFPMTAIDEITYRTPDALFNGEAVASVVKSCVPNIQNPWAMPASDLTSILTAIRIASFGHNYEIETVCPKCSEMADYNIDLRPILDSIEIPDYSKPKLINGLEIFFKPITYKELNDNGKINFEEQQLAKSLTDTENPLSEKEKILMLSESFKKVSMFTIETIANNIGYIKADDVIVDQHEYIVDFLKNCRREEYQDIKDYVIKQRDDAEIKPIQIECTECKHVFEQQFTMDMSSFFA